MRAIVLAPGPEFSVMDVFRGWCKGLHQCGVEVVPFNLHDRISFFTETRIERDGESRQAMSLSGAVEATFEGLMGQVYLRQPDIVIGVSGFFTDDTVFDLLRARGVATVMIHTESPYEDDRQTAIAPHFDINVVNDPINLHRFPPRSMYIPHAYDPDIHHPTGRTSEWDFAFVGTGYPSRVEWLEKVEWGDARVTLAGNWKDIPTDSPLYPMVMHPDGECLDNDQTAALYRMSDMSLNLYRREAERDENSHGWAVGPREIELAACGTFFARDPRGESDSLFPMLPTIADPAELADVLAWSRSNPDLREQAAFEARAAVADRTFKANAGHLLAALDL